MREVLEGLLKQSSEEELSYTIPTTPWASSPSSPVVKALLEPDMSDVTSTVFPTNSPSVDGDNINLSPLKSLTKGHTYRVAVKFTAGANIWQCYFRVECDQ